MADETEKIDMKAEAATPEEPAQVTSKVPTKAKVKAERLKLDETVPGGRYRVGDAIVDAEGKPVEGA